MKPEPFITGPSPLDPPDSFTGGLWGISGTNTVGMEQPMIDMSVQPVNPECFLIQSPLRTAKKLFRYSATMEQGAGQNESVWGVGIKVLCKL